MEDCIFCKIANGVIPSATIYEDENVRVILDISPAAKGHALLLPKKHVKNMYEMDEETLCKIAKVVPKVARAIAAETGCDGMNILQNNEEAAGQTVFHFHIHFIPRFKNDTTQMEWSKLSYKDGEANDLAAKISARI